MEVIYIKHSGFAVELEHTVLIFDYWEGKIPDFPPEKTVYVFVSHKHKDHYNPEVFNLAAGSSHIHYFLSKDTKMNEKYMERKGIPLCLTENITYIGRNERLEFGQKGASAIQVMTLDSTDQGVAFVVQVEQKSIYHGGDLNWWTWEGETQKEEQEMAEKYTREITKLAGRRFDAVFLPLDGRQGERFWYGLDYFMKTADAAVIFPMHCFEDYSVIPRLIGMEISSQYRSRIVPMEEPGEVYVLP